MGSDERSLQFQDQGEEYGERTDREWSEKSEN